MLRIGLTVLPVVPGWGLFTRKPQVLSPHPHCGHSDNFSHFPFCSQSLKHLPGHYFPTDKCVSLYAIMLSFIRHSK